MPSFKSWQWAVLITLLAVLNIAVIGGLILLVATYGLWANPSYLTAKPTVPPWATPTATQRPTFTPTFTPEVWPTATATRIPTPTPFPTATWTPLPTRTPINTRTPSPTDTPIPAPSSTATPTLTPTRTRVPTRTPRPPLAGILTSHQLPVAMVADVVNTSGSDTEPRPTRGRWPTSTTTPTASPSPSPTPTLSLTPKPAAAAPAEEPMDAVPLADNSISLNWEPVANATAYRVYSDMGTGYGMYVLRTETEQHTLTDTNLRPAWRYRYRVAAVMRAGETLVTSASATTPGRAAVASAVGTSAPAISTRVTLGVTPAPTPLPPDTVILGLLSATNYMDDLDGHMIIVGEVRNDTQLDVSDATVTAIFYGSDGHKRGQVTGQTTRQVLAAGARSPFVITVEQPPETATYSLQATGRPSVRTADEAQLTVVNTRRFEDPAGFYHVAGVIENAGSRQVEQARVVVILYDRGRRVVNVGFAYPKPSTLSRGARADFDVAFTYYPKVFSHEAIALVD